MKKKKVAFIGGALPIGGVIFQQDTAHTCSTSGTITSCTYSIFPTTGGSARYVMFGTATNLTISSAFDCTTAQLVSGACPSTGSSDTYTPCDPSCHGNNSTVGDNLSGAYLNSSGSAPNANHITVNFSGSAAVTTNGCVCVFSTLNEYVPPAGLTLSFDGADAQFTAACANPCTLANPTVSGNDLVIHTIDSQTALTAFNDGFTLDYIGNIFNLAATTSTALKANTGTWVTDSAISFKLSGSYTALGTPWAAVTPNQANTNTYRFTNVSCSPTCTALAVPSTSAGLGFIWAVSRTNTVGNFISSISGWAVPSGAGTCRISATGPGQLSCAYNLALGAGVTSITPTMSATDNYDFQFFNLTDSHGTPSLDAQNSTSNSASLTPSGQGLTLTGTASLPDVVFQAMGASEVPPDQSFNSLFITLYPFPGGLNSFSVGASGLLVNTTNGAAPTWSQGTSVASVVAAVAFKP